MEESLLDGFCVAFRAKKNIRMIKNFGFKGRSNKHHQRGPHTFPQNRGVFGILMGRKTEHKAISAPWLFAEQFSRAEAMNMLKQFPKQFSRARERARKYMSE